MREIQEEETRIKQKRTSQSPLRSTTSAAIVKNLVLPLECHWDTKEVILPFVLWRKLKWHHAKRTIHNWTWPKYDRAIKRTRTSTTQASNSVCSDDHGDEWYGPAFPPSRPIKVMDLSHSSHLWPLRSSIYEISAPNANLPSQNRRPITKDLRGEMVVLSFVHRVFQPRSEMRE